MVIVGVTVILAHAMPAVNAVVHAVFGLALIAV